MSFELDPLYLFYGSAALAAVLVVEALYLLLHNTKRPPHAGEPPARLSTKEPDREKVLVQLRRERGLSADGGYRLPIAAFNRLVLQSGVKVRPARVAVALTLLGGLAFAGMFAALGDILYAAAAALFCVTLVPLAVLLFLRKRRLKAFGGAVPGRDRHHRALAARRPPGAGRDRAWWRARCRTRSAPSSAWSPTRSPTAPISKPRCATWFPRIGQEDLPLFVTSVAIQATTGGNLSEILDNLSKVIRERFKMRRKIRGLAAEGRASAMILNAVPFVVFGMINWITPGFYGEVWHAPDDQDRARAARSAGCSSATSSCGA